jgi:hypothetical protein
MAGQDLHLAVQRQIPGELRHHHVGNQRGRGHAALDQSWQHLRLHHPVGAATAGIFGTDRAQHPQDRRNDVNHLADVLADLVQPALAARARRHVRLKHLLAARQVLGQRADVAPRLLARLSGRLRRRGIIVRRCRRRDAGLEIAQLERELLRDNCCEPLRPLAEHHVPERLHHHAQLLVLGIERVHHLDQSHCVGRESFRAKRHDQTIHALATVSSKIMQLIPQEPAASSALARPASNRNRRAASRAALRSDAPRRRASAAK